MRISALIALAAVMIAAVAGSSPISQDPTYHNFADQREWWRVPNFWNVVSNGPFALAGIYGLWVWSRARWHHQHDRWPWLIVAGAAVLIGLGSGYYHWRPNNQTLFWDRLPMTLVFMGLFSAAIVERIDRRWGIVLLGPFVLLGVLSVEVWRQGEFDGVGDLRFYALVQFYPAIALPMVLWMFKSRYSHGSMLWRLAVLYLLAKLAEHYDRQIFAAAAYLVSGHTVKHFLSAWALSEAFRMLRVRRPLQREPLKVARV